MIVFSVRHTNRYKKPVRLGLHELLVRPRDSFDQRLLDCRLNITPAPVEIRWIHDVFGSCLTLVDMPFVTNREAMAEGFSYKRRTSRGTQTPGETLETQQGTCRDFALLMMEKLAASFAPAVLGNPNAFGSR
jgi:hypothetical protein